MSLPPPELLDTKFRTTISIAAPVMIASLKYVDEQKRKRDAPRFSLSGLVEAALHAYMQKHYPDLAKIYDQTQADPSMITTHAMYKPENPTGRKLPKKSKSQRATLRKNSPNPSLGLHGKERTASAG